MVGNYLTIIRCQSMVEMTQRAFRWTGLSLPAHNLVYIKPTNQKGEIIRKESSLSVNTERVSQSAISRGPKATQKEFSSKEWFENKHHSRQEQEDLTSSPRRCAHGYIIHA